MMRPPIAMDDEAPSGLSPIADRYELLRRFAARTGAIRPVLFSFDASDPKPVVEEVVDSALFADVGGKNLLVLRHAGRRFDARLPTRRSRGRGIPHRDDG